MERFKNRWVYALASFICSSIILPILGLILGNPIEVSSYYSMEGVWRHGIFVGFAAALAALICWPSRTTRTMNRMALAGLLTVTLAFILMPIFILLAAGKLSPDNLIESLFIWLLLGSIFTYGIPYIVGIMMALVFVDHSIVETD